MNRRRFFPMESAQQVPGRTVELEMQLQQGGGAPGACECDVLGPVMFPDLIDGLSEVAEDFTQFVQPSVFYLYRPRLEGWRCTGTYVQIPAGWERPVRLRAMLAGATLCDVRWQWTLQTPPLGSMEGYEYESHWGGVALREEDGTLAIEILGGDFVNPNTWWAELRVTALCAGEPAGELVIRPGNNVWDAYSLPAIQ